MEFGGTFKYLNNYDIPQANFNSMLDSLFTLIQLFVGEAWNTVMLAAIDSMGKSALLFFVSYVVITTLLLTNLLMGVIISGYGNIVEIQNDAEEKNVKKIPTKAIATALREGKITEPRLEFTYHAQHIEITHKNPDAKADSGENEGPETKLMGTHINDFKNVMNDSKDMYGFFTQESLENVILYTMIAEEEAKYGVSAPKHRRASSASLSGII